MAASALIIYEHEGLRISASGRSGSSDDVFEIATLTVALDVLDAGSSTQIVLDDQMPLPLQVPMKLLVIDGDVYRLRNGSQLDGLASDEWAALKDRVRRRLASPVEVEAGSELFGLSAIGDARLLFRIWMNPALLDGAGELGADEWLLRAKGAGDVDFHYAAGAGIQADFSGRFLVSARVTKSMVDNVTMDFGFDLPSLPGFDLSLPSIHLPKFSWPDIDLDFPALRPTLFSLSLPSWVGSLAFHWTTTPKLKLSLVAGKLALATSTAGEGAFSVGGNEWVKVRGFALNSAGTAFDFAAQMDATPRPLVIADQKIANDAFPFTLELTGNTIVATISDLDLGGGNVLANADFSFEFASTRIAIASQDDPAVMIALALAMSVRYDVGTGKTVTDVTSLKILEPYPVELIRRAGSALGELIRLVGAIPLPSANLPGVDPSGVMRLLARIVEMLGSAAKWLARQAGKAAGMLAGIAEAIFETLMQLGEKLGDLTSISHLAIEMRLDPKNYSLRQILLMPVADEATLSGDLKLSAFGVNLDLDASFRPALVIDFGPESWFGLVVQAKPGAQATLGTDLWLDKETGPQQAMGSTDKDGLSGNGGRLIQLKASAVAPVGTPGHDIVLLAMQNGRPKLFQTFGRDGGDSFSDGIQFGSHAAIALRETGVLRDAGILYDGNTFPDGSEAILELKLETADLKDRILSMLGKADSSAAGGGFFDSLKQKVEITETKFTFDGAARSVDARINVKVHIDEDFAPETQISIAASLRDLSMKVSGGDKIDVYSKPDQPIVTYHPLAMDLTISPKNPALKEPGAKPYKQFFIDLAHGSESLGLADEATAQLAYGQVSTSGKGLQFEVPVFRVGRSGFDVEARILPEPVTLGGVDVPFRFTSGQVSIKGSKFGGGSLSGTGQLPQQLIGEANASISLQLGAGEGGGVVVKGATAKLDKSGDPIRSTSTRFELTITELGLDFVNSGGYHFYFLLTGTAVYKPGGGESTTGLLKNFKDITIKLDKAPLAADPRVLLKSISFQVKVDPPKRMSFFDIFDFELRGFGFHPASPKFDGDPAMSVSGQVSFTKAADKISPNFEFHSLWIAAPKPGSAKPRVRFDGLTVGLKTGSVHVEGTAIAVDGAMPELYRPDILPQDVTAEGFLASGRLDIDGWASMSAAMGFLELRKKNTPSRPRHSFFLYGQMEKLAEPIDTPVGRIYLREFGFGFGYRYTLAGIARAETAKSPQELVKVLDEVSKYQGSLNTFQAWEPTYDNDDLTLALRGMFALSAATQSGEQYDPKKEAELPNPLLFDIVAAFRTDLTFLINLRAWVSVNYHDWTSSWTGESWKSNPTMRGYLYFSVPRKEFLGRFISDGKGHVGVHPKLPEPLREAISSTQFSATLYIRPGLFHAELGWPYELGFTLGRPTDNFYMEVKGGLIHRIEDASVLNGIAFKAKGAVYLEGRVGGSSLGAAAVARANFSIEARVLSYLSLKDLSDSFYYGFMRIDVAVGVSVEFWLSFKIFSKRITLSASFSLHLALSIAIEAVIGPDLIGGRAHVSIGVRAFGRSLSVTIGLSFNDDKLAIARAKVARFMELGLAAPIPDQRQDGQRVERNPSPEPSRGESARLGDQVVQDVIGAEPPPTTPAADELPIPGRPIGPADFWALLYPTRAPMGQSSAEEWYVMQLLPRDHTPGILQPDDTSSTFFASPRTPDPSSGFSEPGHQLVFDAVPPDTDIHISRLTFGTAVPIRPAGEGDPVGMDLTVVVAKNETETLPLGRLLQALFLGSPDEDSFGGDLQEPDAREIQPSLTSIDPGAKASADQLARAGRDRSNLSGKQRREAEIEEARSAVLSAVVETAGLLASAGSANGLWPPRLPEIDARDFGLTFLVNTAAIKALFEGDASVAPPTGRFRVLKSDATPSKSDGSVHLFNHPDRMFRKAQPKFSPTHVIDQHGVKLNWDLEPAWGASVGVYDDPEFHLKYYRVRRTIRGIPGREYRADFTVKAVAPIQHKEGASSFSFLRPDFQFVDDLQKQDLAAGSVSEELPDSLRALLLNQATTSSWDETFLSADRIENISLFYEIVPVDNAGTSDFGQSYIIDGFSLIVTRPISPQEVTLQVTFDGMPSHLLPTNGSTKTPPPPQLRLLLKPARDPARAKDDTDGVIWPDQSVYLLRIWPQALAPSGDYGSDAVDEARRRPDQDAIERSLPGARDFILSAKSVKLDPDDAPLVAEFHPEGADHATLRTYQLALHDIHDGLKELGPARDLKDLEAALDVVNEPKAERRGYRAFLAAINLPQSGKRLVNPARRGEWKTVGFNIAIARQADDPSESVTAISSVVEVLEQPVHLEFKPIERSDMRIEGGRVIVLQPGADSDLSSISGGTGIDAVRDAARRTATRLTWNANPASLALTTGQSANHAAIGGFDLHCVDPDTLPGRAIDDDNRIADIVANARSLGRVSLLSPELNGLDPGGFGDLGRLESAYPSDTLLLANRDGGARKAMWYSAAETTAIFPEPAIQRSIMADPDEGLIATLFSGGKPARIRVSIPAWIAESPLQGWRIDDVGGAGWGEFSATTAIARDRQAWTVIFEARGGFTVSALRQLLQNLRLAPIAAEKDLAKKQEGAVLTGRIEKPAHLSSVEVLLEALRFGPGGADIVVATDRHSFDVVPPLHPVLHNALAFLQYDAQSGDIEQAGGKIYRRFALAPDNNPEVTAKQFDAYLDEAPPERDPYGWGALRTLGLATGFKLFDTERGDYLRFSEPDMDLGRRINLAFTRALARYPDRDNGQPFVDILTQPWGNVELAWFDGGHRAPNGPEDVERIKGEMLAVTQIALRPHPDRMVATETDGNEQVVRYYALVTDARGPIGDRPWTVTALDFDKARYDVLTVARTMVSQKPLRLTPEQNKLDIFESRPPVMLDDHSGKRVVAVVREVRLADSSFFTNDELRLDVKAPPDAPAAHKWEAISRPVVMDKMARPDQNISDLAFGRFDNLQGGDWGDALFRPSPSGVTFNPCLAVTRLGYYAGRRFAALAIPLATTGGELEEYSRARGELAHRIVRFWTPFLEHCAPNWGWQETEERFAKGPNAIFFSLGTVADPGQWRRAPTRSGTVSVTIVDSERRGARRKFAVRPYGRYEAWSRAAPDKLGLSSTGLKRFPRAVPVGLDGAFEKAAADDIGRMYFIDATLPRTQPLEKPVILSSVTHQPAQGKPGRMELVVAHGSDTVLGQANRRNAARLAPLDISVGYWREFAHMPWAALLKTRHELSLDAMQGFGSLDARLDQAQLTITPELAQERLTNLRQRVPDAWLGSTMITATNLPYFFRVHALVHSTAGVIVSDQVATTFEEGFYKLHWPYDPWGADWTGRKAAQKHRYSVDRRQVPDQDQEITILTFSLSALRFIDCMLPDDAMLWFGKDGEHWQQEFRLAAHLPEPGVSYRIAVETVFETTQGTEPLARAPEIEVLPKPPSGDGNEHLYLLQQSGTRFTPKLEVAPQTGALGTDPVPAQDGYEWQIPVAVQLTHEPAPIVRRVEDALVPLLGEILSGQAPQQRLPTISMLRDVKIVWAGAPAAELWTAVIAALTAAHAPEAVALLEPIAAGPPDAGAITLPLPPYAIDSAEVVAALKDLAGAEPVPEPATSLILRRPPTDEELAIFQSDGTPAAIELAKWISGLAGEQLFGPGRRPVVLAFKGTEPPIQAGFEPRLEE